MGLVLFFQLGSWGVTESSEARYAEIAREMYLSKDIVQPTLLKIFHYHKPPFTYAITALSYSIFGINAFAARFFLVVFFLIQVFAIKRLSELLFPKKQNIGLVSILIFCSLPLSILGVRNLTTDTYLSTFSILSILAWVQYRQKDTKFDFYIFYLLMALGFLTKGPVIFLPTLPFILIYNFSYPSDKKFSLQHILGPLLFLILGFSWYIAAIFNKPELFDYFLGTQTIDRVATKKFNRSEPFWYYLLTGTLTMLPWSLIYILKAKGITKIKKGSSLALSLGFLISLFIYSLVSSKLILYLQPLSVFISIYLANVLLSTSEKNAELIKKFVLIFSMLAMVIISIAIWQFGDRINIQFKNYFFVVPLLSLIAIIFIYRSSEKLQILTAPLITFVTLSAVILLSTFVFNNNQITINSFYEVAEFIDEQNLHDNEILVYNKLLPSLEFHLNRDLRFIVDGSYSYKREVQFQNNDKWREYWLYTNNGNDQRSIEEYQNNGSILFSRRQKEPTDLYLQLVAKYPSNKVFGKYILYY